MLKQTAQTITLALALVACAGGRLSFAQERWYQLYDEGVRAFQRQQWTLAEEKFKAALALNKQQGRRQAFYGTRRDDYLPEYYLAQIYFRDGRASDAAPLIDRLQRAGLMTPRDKEFAEFSRMSDQLARASSRPPPTGPPSNPGTLTAQQGGPAANPNPLPPAGADTAGANRQARVDVPPASGADANSGTSRIVNDSGVAVANGRGGYANAPGAATGPTSTGPSVRTQRPALNNRPAVAPTQPPAIADFELRAVSAFYRGEYPAAMSLLESPAYLAVATSDLARRKRLFYLACSGAAVVLTESGDANRLAQARAQFAEAQGSGPMFAEHRRYISPRILKALEGAQR